MAGPTDYAQVTDVLGYLPDAPQSDLSSVLTTLLHVVSRDIDRFCNQYFYNDGAATRYFDGDGTTKLLVAWHSFFTVTAVKVAQWENADPASSADWITLDGDGVTPPSNFYLEPGNQPYAGQAGSALLKPFYKIELPAAPKAASANFVGSFTAGKRTVAVTASGWGWPAIPDDLKDLTCKVVIRMWRAGTAGFAGVIGSPGGIPGQNTILKYLDVNDLVTLNQYRREAA